MKNGTRVQVNPTTFNSFLSFSNGRSEVKWSKCCSVMSDSLQPHELYSPKNSPGQNTGVGSLSLIQGIFQIQQSRGESFYRQRTVLHAETAQSALTVILRLVIGGLISNILIVLGTIFSSRIVCFHFLRPVLRIVAATVWASWVSFSIWDFSIYKTVYGSEYYL